MSSNEYLKILKSITSKEQIERVLDGWDWILKVDVVKSKYFGPEYMEIALNDNSPNVRVTAMLSNSHMIIKNLDELLYFTQVYD